MIDRRENGGYIGPYATGNISSANGIWSVYDQYMFTASNNWPGISILNGVQYIVIAGGGGGGSTHAGGGGAGGYRAAVAGEASGGGGPNEGNLVAFINTPYSISVGGGGSAGADRPFNGANGTTSYFATISCVGGGGAGSEYKTGLGGGSGGGHATNGTVQTAQGTANQGYQAGYGFAGSGLHINKTNPTKNSIQFNNQDSKPVLVITQDGDVEWHGKPSEAAEALTRTFQFAVEDMKGVTKAARRRYYLRACQNILNKAEKMEHQEFLDFLQKQVYNKERRVIMDSLKGEA